MLMGLPRSRRSHAPEHRARKHHQDRVAETLREEIGAMIEGELSDPRIAFCYVSEVALNPGGKSARVYVAVDNAVPDITLAEAETVAGLESAKGYIRYELKERMGVRHVPELSFIADRSGRFQARIDELLSRSRKYATKSGRPAEMSTRATIRRRFDPPKERLMTASPSTRFAPAGWSCRRCPRWRNGYRLRRILDALRRGQRFLVCSHARPDGDAVGSVLAFGMLIEQMGKQADMVSADRVPHLYRMLPGASDIRVVQRVDGPYDAAILLECDGLERAGIAGLDAFFLINIDHHYSGRGFAQLNWIDQQRRAWAR